MLFVFIVYLYPPKTYETLKFFITSGFLEQSKKPPDSTHPFCVTKISLKVGYK